MAASTSSLLRQAVPALAIASVVLIGGCGGTTVVSQQEVAVSAPLPEGVELEIAAASADEVTVRAVNTTGDQLRLRELRVTLVDPSGDDVAADAPVAEWVGEQSSIDDVEVDLELPAGACGTPDPEARVIYHLDGGPAQRSTTRVADPDDLLDGVIPASC